MIIPMFLIFFTLLKFLGVSTHCIWTTVLLLLFSLSYVAFSVKLLAVNTVLVLILTFNH